MDNSWKETMVKATRPVRIAAAVALAMLALFLLVKTIDSMHNWGQPDTVGPNTITVSGEGKSFAMPDTATVSFTAMATASDVATAQKNVTDTVSAATNALSSDGISSSDVTTTSYNVDPHYTYTNCSGGVYCPANSSVSGYDVSETVQVQIHDTTKVSDVLAALGKAKVSNITGPDLTVGDPQIVMQQARAQAIQKAQQDAQKLASELGVKLGKVVSFDDNSGNVSPEPLFEAKTAGVATAAMAPSTPTVPVGQNEYDDTVSVTYEIH